MVRAYSLDLKERIMHFHLQGETMRSVAETHVSLLMPRDFGLLALRGIFAGF